jgi:hypothetical protein
MSLFVKELLLYSFDVNCLLSQIVSSLVRLIRKSAGNFLNSGMLLVDHDHPSYKVD